jgi:hypothetical protein
VPAFENGEKGEGMQWSAMVAALLDQSPRPIDVASSLVKVIEPMSWSGSLAKAAKLRLSLARPVGARAGPAVCRTGWEERDHKTIDREARQELDEPRRYAVAPRSSHA